MMKHSTKSPNQIRLKDDDKEEEAILLQAAAEASRKAVEESQALGLTIHIIRDNKIIAIHPDNSEEVIKELPESTSISSK
jgi:hypothetical protein